ncbi:hypothetical protein [Flavobacterium granuli]|uniref:Uncharacterized protein n=1 Tax=Flavobacterium granuli TaxID=280093 RepID=A0A1M5UFZ3_9FLAO|nr:hypothetical protein [Flavobacterium granuli]PRZ18341.1 hypothetical protein BC624_1281 [Flavobacterium granuli]SHH61861.1 hypothetical protein SAMN05443373_1311 [Flavobacterium granuli]
MAKIIAPFLIKGTLDDINFVITADGNNYARMKGKTGVSPEEFKKNPVFNSVREHGKEFGHCAKKAVVFRQLASLFNNQAKEVSFVGRANKLLFEILQEDTSQPQGQRTLTQGLKTNDGKEALLFFESNKLRPLERVLKIKAHCQPQTQTTTLADFTTKDHLDWPEEATHVILAAATANWDFENDICNSCYSNEIILDKQSEKQTINLTTAKPLGNHLQLTFLFIGFAIQQRKKFKMLHRKNNTTTLIAYHSP